MPATDDCAGFSLVISKKVAKTAVSRNRLKRVVLHLLAEHAAEEAFFEKTAGIIILSPASKARTREELRHDLMSTLDEARQRLRRAS